MSCACSRPVVIHEAPGVCQGCGKKPRRPEGIREGFVRTTRRLTLPVVDGPEGFSAAVQGEKEPKAILPTHAISRDEWRKLVATVDALFEAWS